MLVKVTPHAHLVLLARGVMATTTCSSACSSDESASTILRLGFYTGFKGSQGPMWKYLNFELDENGPLILIVSFVFCALLAKLSHTVVIPEASHGGVKFFC